jgi:uncharacterized protein DUF6988
MTAALDELKSVVQWIDGQTIGLELPADRRSRIVFGCLDLALEHQAGISVLAGQLLWGPAYALIRCLFDSFIRGMWLAHCATESDLDLFTRGKLGTKDFGVLVDDIERTLGHTDLLLSKLKKKSWNLLNDFTHTGYQHVVRRNSMDKTGPNYPTDETEAALRLVSALGLLTVSEFTQLSGHRDIAIAANERAKQFVATRPTSSGPSA